MEKKIPVELKAVIYFMLIYSVWLFLSSRVTPIIYYSPGFLKLALRRSSGLPPVTLLASLIYLVSGIGLLWLKNWSRKLVICFSVILMFLMALILLGAVITIIKRAVEGFGVIETDFMLRKIFPYLPAVLFFIFFTRPKIKELFEK